MTPRQVVLALAALAVLLVAGATTAAALLFDGEALKPRAIEAVRRAAGRELTIAGPVRLGWSLTPTVTAERVSLANPPGMSRPAMATLDRLDVQVALWPLLRRRVEVRGLTLIGPDVLLERDAAGQPNWHEPSTKELPRSRVLYPGGRDRSAGQFRRRKSYSRPEPGGHHR